jgi:transcriptional regulator with XRE-family HTH domain
MARKRPPPAARRRLSFEPHVAEAFGIVLRNAREKRAIAQDQFALSADIDRSYYGKLERGERQPSLGLILRIAGALGVPAHQLVKQAEARLAKAPPHRK